MDTDFVMMSSYIQLCFYQGRINLERIETIATGHQAQGGITKGQKEKKNLLSKVLVLATLGKVNFGK